MQKHGMSKTRRTFGRSAIITLVIVAAVFVLSTAVFAEERAAAGENPAVGESVTVEESVTDGDGSSAEADSSGAVDADDKVDMDGNGSSGGNDSSGAANAEGLNKTPTTNEGMAADVEVKAKSKTNNIVGEVFVHMVEQADEEGRKAREASLKEFPLDPHDLEYYGDSLRVRLIEGEDEEGPNYLVYRDSYLMISQKASSKYTVTYSEDGTEAYVTPAIPASELEGKMGIVFLADFVGDDDILVFAGAPVYEDGSMTVPLLTADEITVNQLFSDGKLAPAQKKKGAAQPMGGIPTADYNSKVSGTNWSGTVEDFSFTDVSVDPSVDIFELDFSVGIKFKTEMSFDITSKGSSGKDVNTAKVAKLSIPIEIFDLNYEYNLQVKFDDHPVHVKGKILTEFKYSLGVGGAMITRFRNPVTLEEFQLKNPDDVNKDVEFYIGAQFTAQCGVLGYNIPIIDVDIGPILSINQDSRGGCWFHARHEKDLYDKGTRTGDRIHTCAIHGLDGCVDFKIEETRSMDIFFMIDLYFDSWDKKFTLVNQTLPAEYAYMSYTFHSGYKKGYCPHAFYRVPVAVWSDHEFTKPVAGMNVTVADKVSCTDDEDYLLHSVTDSSGKADLYLPYRNNHRYTMVASGELEGKTFAGSAQMEHYISKEDNRQVNILLSSDEKVTLKTDLIWNTDLQKKEVPNSDFTAAVLRREAGSDDSWERVQDIRTNKAGEWVFRDLQLEKFGAEGSRVYLYEYCVMPTYVNGRYMNPDGDPVYSFVDYGVNAYVDAVGVLEPEHDTRFYIESTSKAAGDVIRATITATPGIDLRVNKKWRLTKEGSRAVPVYLAALRKPQDGWEDIAEEKGVALDWLPVTSPLAEGSRAHTASTTLAKLEDASVVSVYSDITPIENNRLAIGEVNSGNSWRLIYTVPKFQNGIKMQFQGGEIDGSLIEKLLAYEYDLDADAVVKEFGDFVSVPFPLTTVNYATFNADVVNMDPIEEGTLRGTVRWDDASGRWDNIPDTVELTVYKDGEAIDENPIILKKSDHSKGDEIWVWTLKVEDFDPEATYTVQEKTEKGRLNQVWVPEHDGLDVYNGYVGHETVMVEVRASFEGDPNISELTAKIKSGSSTVNTVKLEKNKGWFLFDHLGGIDSGITIDNVKDISEYQFEAPDIEGYEKFYGEPVVTGEGISMGNLTYSYSVRYMKKDQNLQILLDKEILGTDSSTPYDAYPDTLTVKVYRNGVWIKDAKLEKSASLDNRWTAEIIDRDNEGNPLRRLDENGNKYIYTFSEEPVDGFSSEVKLRYDLGDQLVYRIVNRWVGSDHVHIKGTVRWEGDEGRTDMRPDSVRLSVINSNEEYVRSIDVPVKDGTYESKYLPRKDADGNVLKYSVLQSKAQGYTTSYSEPVYDEETRTWTCDVTNTLTGYFPMTIKKVIDGTAPKTPETYKFTVQPLTEGVPAEKVAPELTEPSVDIKGAGTAKVEFLLDKDGLYYYTVKEEKGSDASCSYDEKERLVLISKKTEKEGGKPVVSFGSWVIDSLEDATDPSKLDKLKSDTVTFTNVYPNIEIEKKWDIDLAGKDKPNSVQVVVQKEQDGKWTTFKTVELNEENEWKAKVSDPNRSAETKYRVRELKPQSAGSMSEKDRIVYDKNDKDKGSGETNAVRYLVEDHHTKYKVTYGEKKDNGAYSFTVTNKAIVEVDVVKRWITFGVDDEDLPDSAWLVLMCSPKIEALDAARNAGVDVSGILDYEFPVINPIAGGHDPISIVSELVLGVDINVFSKFGVVPKLAIAKAKKEGDDASKSWTVHFTDSKYHMGIPVEYKGAELSSEIIRQIIKYVSDGALNLPVSYNPFNNYFSIPTKAIRTIAGITQVEDLLDFSKLSDKLLEKAKTITLEDIKNFGPETLLDDDQLMANAVNVKIDFDQDDDDDDDDDPDENTIYGQKTWVDDNDKLGERPDTITVRLFADGKEVAAVKTSKEAKWKYFFPDRPKTDEQGNAISYEIKEDPVTGYTTTVEKKADNRFDITNTLRARIDVKVTKKWKDKDNQDGIRPKSVTVKLFANGADTGKSLTLSEANGWKDSFQNLYRDDESGAKIAYTVEETATSVITGKDAVGTYKPSLSGSAEDGFTVTNTHTPETVTLSGHKTWNDDNNREGARPNQITVRLMANGKEAASKTVTEKDGWSWTFEDMAKYEDGKVIRYVLTEDLVDDYTQTISGMNITNTHTPGKTQVNVYKWWDDVSDRDGVRPDHVTVHLLQNGRDTGRTLRLDESNGWYGSFTDLYKMEDQKEIEYSVEEDFVKDYQTEIIDGRQYDAPGTFLIKNTHEPESVTVAGKKVWDDDDNRDGTRPDKVIIRLYWDGLAVSDREVTADDGWEWSFGEFYKNRDGKESTFTIMEDPVKDYVSEITGSVSDGFTVTNKHMPDRTQVNVSGTWDDDDDRDGIRPESVKVKLLADGKDTGKTLELTAKDNWTGSFTNLYRKNAGKEIRYTVVEEKTDVLTRTDGPGTYAVVSTGNAEAGFRFSHIHTPEKVTISGSKTWDDANDHDDKRPESITVRLSADGTEIASSTVTSEDDWKWSFDNLYKYQDGEPIDYVLSEDPVEGYTAEVNGYDVTNTHVPWYTVTYDLNGGVFDGSGSAIKEQYEAGMEISIHKAPTREGYTFLYWKGSQYQPGDKYVVTEDHTFVAQWKKKTVPDEDDDDPDDPDDPNNPDDDPDNDPDDDPGIHPHDGADGSEGGSGGSGHESTRGANTGDNNVPLLWLVVLLTTLVELGVVVLLRRYEERRR